MVDKEQVIQALRATLISVKGALTIRQCNYDYKELQGEWIPFKKLGYPTLEKLFLDVPGFKVSQINGEWYVDAIASQETQHIVAMVAKQKTSKKSIRLNQNSRFPRKQGSWRKPAPSSNYSSNYNNQYSNQFYRAKTTSYNNNNNYHNVKYTYPNKYSKPNETTHAAPPPIKQTPRTVTEYPPKIAPNVTTKTHNSSTTTSPRETNNHTKDITLKTSLSIITSNAYQTMLKHLTQTNVKTTEGEVPSIKVVKQSPPAEKELPPEPKPSGKVSASQRLSNLRDRLNTVDLIPLQFPSANTEILPAPSGPVTHVAPAHILEPLPELTSSVEKLQWTCRKLGLPDPVFKQFSLKPKRGPVVYDCQCKIGTQYSESSYPHSSPSEDLAKEMVAAKLLEMIESADVNLPTSSSVKAMSCLADLVSEYEAGLWANTVPHFYRKRYEENLPNNWRELVENCPRIVTDRVVNGLLVLLPKNEDDQPTLDTTIYSLDDGLDSELPPLQFPEDDFWNVFVTVANSTLEVWLRIIGPQYSDVFEVLQADMTKHYERGGTKVEKSMIIKNAWYAVRLDDGEWHRAKILEVEEVFVTVFLGDHGDDDVALIDCIKILEPQFRKLPAQAILCRLEGCEELAATEEGAALVARRLPGEVLVAAPGARDDPHDPSVAVVLYDTSTTRDLNLNKEIVHDFCTSGAFTLTQDDEIDKLCEVEVGCVTEEGRVWVARAGGGARVSAALALLASGPYRRPLPAAPKAPSPNANTLYIVKTLAGDWVRCTIISGLDGEGTVRTQLVDSGMVLRAPLSSLVPLQHFSPALNEYPPQAIQVRLGAAERAASTMVSRLREMLLGTCVVCRAQPSPSNAPSSTPQVELFVRTGPHNILASVNNAIITEYDYITQKPKGEEKECPNTVEALNKKKERIFRSSSTGSSLAEEKGESGALPPPALPAPGKCFDVYVAMVANPCNFVVQPNSTRNALVSMMETLQKECPKLLESQAPMQPAKGELYTVFYDKDNTWYRVLIAGSVSHEMVSVYFCDYGDLALFANKALRPVPEAAPLARSLPPQAIKARLYDVRPLHQDWTVEDCIRFQALCVEQQFVGICKEVGKDPLNPSEPLLTLDLIDTSTDEDIYLNKQLVAEGRARHVTAS